MEQLLSPQRVAEILDCKRGHVYKLIRDGELQAEKYGPRMVRIAETELKRYRERKCKSFGGLAGTAATHARSEEQETTARELRYATIARRTQRLISAT